METQLVLFCECLRGENQANFVDFSNGEVIYDCLICGGAVIDYQDCLGG